MPLRVITLAMNARVSQLEALNNVIWDKAPQEKLTVQQPVMQLREVNTVISVPDDGTVALVLDRKDDLKEARDRTLLLLISPTIIGAKAP